MTAPRFPSEAVRAYYDANTGAFVRHGQGGALGVIHRAVWGPGVRTRDQAFRFVEDVIAVALDDLNLGRTAQVIDLGCGIGASLTYLAGLRDIRGTGVTLSPAQAQIGRDRVDALRLTDRVRIVEGDYCAMAVDTASTDLAYAIESFVHGPSPARFFAEVARVLRPGGRLVICDDVRTEVAADRAAPTIARFTRGWHVNSLLTAADLRLQAERAGFAALSAMDLTPYLELDRPRDRLIAALALTVGWLPTLPPRLAALVGGSALQRGLSAGWIAYQCTSFQRR